MAQCGMVDLSVIGAGGDLPKAARDTDTDAALALRFGADLRDCLHTPNVVALVGGHCDVPAIDKEERRLWLLMRVLLEDCENTPRYDPAALGIAAVPPTRRWFVSHHALIQQLLMRHTNLRRMALVLRWLEQTAAAETIIGQPDRSHPSELVNRLVFAAVRAGDMRAALQHAVHSEHTGTACALTATQLSTSREPWMARTSVVPLFGEYANGDRAAAGGGPAWPTNDHRLAAVAALYDESAEGLPGEQPTDATLQRAICGALAGNADAMARAFGASRRWQDELWCRLRAALITVFSKTLFTYGHSVASPVYLSAVTASIPAQSADWTTECEAAFSHEIVAFTRHARCSAQELSPAEALQLRFISAMLENSSATCDVLSCDVPRGAASRAPFHAIAALDIAHTASFTRFNPQQSPHFVPALLRHVEHLALCGTAAIASRSRTLLHCGATVAIDIAAIVRCPSDRARAYAAVLCCARQEAAQRKAAREEIQQVDEFLIEAVRRTEARAHGEARGVLDQVLEVLASTPAAEAVRLLQNEEAEGVMWRSLCSDALGAFRSALLSCARFHRAGEHGAICDVVDILGARVVPRLMDEVAGNGREGADTDSDATSARSAAVALMPQFVFWRAFARAFRVSREQQRRVAELLSEPTSAVVALQLRVAIDEARNEMADACEQAIRGASSVAEAADAAAVAVELYGQCAALEMRIAAHPSSVFASLLRLVMELESAGLMEVALSATQAARTLDAVRCARAALADRQHAETYLRPWHDVGAAADGS